MSIILYPPKNAIAFSLFNLDIRWYGLIMAFSILIGIVTCFNLLKKRYSLKEADFFLDFCPYLIIFSITGARVFYVLGDIDYYISNPFEIFLINHGGLSIFGAVTFGGLYLVLLSIIKKINLIKYVDVVSVSLPICQAIGRFGNFINQEAYGRPTDFIIKMYIDKIHRYPQFINEEFYHPTFLYESFLNLLLFICLLFLFSKNKNMKAGDLFCLYLLSYSIIRIIIETIRIDSVYNFANIPIAIIICLVAIVFSFVLFSYNRLNH